MSQKTASMVSGCIFLAILLAAGVAGVFPGWILIPLGDAEYLNYGPIISCVGENYFGSCAWNNFGDCNDSLCAQKDAAVAFLVIGGVFSFVTTIVVFVGACKSMQGGITTTRKAISVILHCISAASFIISFALVINLFSPTNFPTPYGATFGISFDLTVAAAGLAIFSLIIYVVFNICVKPPINSSADFITSPLINNAYTTSSTTTVFPHPYSQVPSQSATPSYPQSGYPEAYPQPAVYQQYRQYQPYPYSQGI